MTYSRRSLSPFWRRFPRSAGGAAACAVLAFAACRTNIPEEVFYEGVVNAGGRASAGSGGRLSTGGSVGGGAGGSLSTAGHAGQEAQSGAAGGSDEQPEPGRDCGPAPILEGAFTRQALRNAAAECASWHFCEFENVALKLEGRLQNYAQTPGEDTLTRTQDTWKEAMSVWSRVELFQFGPLSSRTESAGKDVHQGQGVRELIYAWPVVARCRVEDQIISRGFADRGMDSVLISGRGLYALEYLLFYGGEDSACAAATPTAKTWSTLEPAEISVRKLEYASALSRDLVQRIQALSWEYDLEGGGFKAKFVDATGYPSEQEALNVLTWALMYVDREMKDWKLGVPAGYTLTHPVAQHEAPFSNLGTEILRGNLQGFRSLFQGCGPNGEGIGFDDWLNEAGHAELASDIVRAGQAAQAAADAFPPYAEASQADLQALYASVKVLTDLLKGELFGSGSPLNLEFPDGVPSDTD